MVALFFCRCRSRMYNCWSNLCIIVVGLILLLLLKKVLSSSISLGYYYSLKYHFLCLFANENDYSDSYSGLASFCCFLPIGFSSYTGESPGSWNGETFFFWLFPKVISETGVYKNFLYSSLLLFFFSPDFSSEDFLLSINFLFIFFKLFLSAYIFSSISSIWCL